MAMRYRQLSDSTRDMVGVYRSPISGRGLFCKRGVEAGQMVIEYAGQVSTEGGREGGRGERAREIRRGAARRKTTCVRASLLFCCYSLTKQNGCVCAVIVLLMPDA